MPTATSAVAAAMKLSRRKRRRVAGAKLSPELSSDGFSGVVMGQPPTVTVPAAES